MPSSYPAGLDPLPLPAWDQSLGQPARTAESLLTDITDSIKALQESVGTAAAPGPLLLASADGTQVLTPSQFGTLGAGNDSAVLQSWLDNVIGESAVGYAPPGDYILYDPIVDPDIDAAKGALLGGGVGVTRFIVPSSNTDGAFLLADTGAGRDTEFLVGDFDIVTQGTGEGTGFGFTIAGSSNLHKRSIVMRNMRIYGEDSTAHCFDVGIDLSGCERPLLHNVTYDGAAPADGDITDTSLRYATTAALVIDDCYEAFIDACHFWQAHTLIRDIGVGAESFRIQNCQLVGGRVGIQRYRPGREPHVQIENCHIHCRDTNIDIDGAKIAIIKGNHIYNGNTTSPAAPPRDVWFKNTEMSLVNDNVFHFAGPTARINIDIDGTEFANAIGISDNIFNCTGSVNAIRIGAGATNVYGSGNQYPGTYTKDILDNSGTAVFFDAVYGGSTGAWMLTNQNAGAGIGPTLKIMRDSSSPAVADDIGALSFLGKDSVAADTEYAALRAAILDPTNASEDGQLNVWAQIAGTFTRLAAFSGGMPSNSTAMYLLVNRAGTVSLQRVSLGATGSGGTGLRALVVPD